MLAMVLFAGRAAAAGPGLELRLTWAATPTAAVQLDLAAPPPDRWADETPDEEVRARLAFLRAALEDTKLHGQLWAWGWLGFYALGVGAQSVRAAIEDRPSVRADFVVSAVKSGIGIVTHTLRLPRSRLGADDIPAYDPRDPAGNLAALRLAEAALRQDARRAAQRYSWIAHATSVLLNVAGALVVGLGYDNWPRGITSAAVGIAVGQVVVWSQPWQPEGHVEAYEARFGGPHKQRSTR